MTRDGITEMVASEDSRELRKKAMKTLEERPLKSKGTANTKMLKRKNTSFKK